MKFFGVIWCFCVISVSAQEVELAIQKGHSSSINRLEFSASGSYLLSLGKKNDAIVWDLIQRKVLTEFKLPQNDSIWGIKFMGDEKIKLAGRETLYFFDLEEDKVFEIDPDKDSTFRRKNYYAHADGIHQTEIKKGDIQKRRIGKFLFRYSIAVTYTNAPFIAFDISLKNDLIVGVAENNVIYVNKQGNGKKVMFLEAHNSPARDIRFSPDENYFATAGDDRSIVVWNSITLKEEFRLYSKIFKKKTANFSYDGKEIYVGDELGNLFTIDFGTYFPECDVKSKTHSLNKIQRGSLNDKEGYFVAGSNNRLQFYNRDNGFETYSVEYVFRQHSFMQAKKIFLQKYVNAYQEPIGEVVDFQTSPSNKKLVFTGKSENPNVTYVDLLKNERKHLYSPENWRSWKRVDFAHENLIIALHENAGELYSWQIDKSKLYFQRDSLPFFIEDFQVLNDSVLWLCTKSDGQYTFNLQKKSVQKISGEKGVRLFAVKNSIVVDNLLHDLVFFNKMDLSKEFVLEGHGGAVTDLNKHPEKSILVSSSDDGTVRIWDYHKQVLIATVVPFSKDELVIVTPDNYYLISKGAFKEIGFKHKGSFFYPDQFDLKYNRPDIVLERLGYQNEELIQAYRKAYEKRLKKLNFDESSLSTSLHLPEVKIINRSSTAGVSKEKTITLKIELSDSEVLLDRYNVWINEVAVFGVNGVSLREKATKDYELTLPLDLGYGKNKIEISALNEAGAESYKEVLNIFCESGKERPDAYIVTIGISEYKTKKYNLAYAAKDAIDMEDLFLGNNYFGTVHTKTMTNEAVTLENLSAVGQFLSKADVDDLVLIFVAGHGVLDDEFDYYFASHDMDFNNPSKRGIPYSRIEELVDGLKSLKKLLILDTCHSGELDKDEVEKSDEKEENEDPGDWNFRNVGVNVSLQENILGFTSTTNLMKSLFTDLRRGTGATVISSAGGAELAIESSKFQNGLFTYCLMDGLESRKADANQDKHVSISELQKYVSSKVSELSGGKQVPTSRVQNKELDYRIW